jgi:hypothetical protein
LADTDRALQLRLHFPDLHFDFGLLMKPDDNIHKVIRKTEASEHSEESLTRDGVESRAEFVFIPLRPKKIRCFTIPGSLEGQMMTKLTVIAFSESL